jgi:hypothetical protein
MKKLLIFILFSFFCCTLCAADKQPPQGIWQGTVANLPVIVSFDGENNGYFYLKYLKPIPLQTQNQSFTDWQEKTDGQVVANWHLTNITDDKITGTWSSVKNEQKVNIQLSKLNSIPDNNYVDILHLAKAFQQKVTRSKIQQFGKYQYRSLVSSDQKSLELIGDTPNIQQLNSMLKIGLQTQISNYYGCTSPAEMGRGNESEPDYQSHVDIKFWNSDWIVFEEFVSGDCGGAYPFVNYSKRTVNLSTLKTTQLWTWFYNIKADDQLMKIIAKRAYKQRKKLGMSSKSEEDSCLTGETSIYETDYVVSIGKKGLVFSTQFPHVAQACDEEVEMAYKELMPYLNTEGKKQVSKLIAHIRK